GVVTPQERPHQQEGGEEEEDGDAAGDPVEPDVVEHHEADRETAQTVQLGAEAARAGGGGTGRGRAGRRRCGGHGAGGRSVSRAGTPRRPAAAAADTRWRTSHVPNACTAVGCPRHQWYTIALTLSVTRESLPM